MPVTARVKRQAVWHTLIAAGSAKKTAYSWPCEYAQYQAGFRVSEAVMHRLRLDQATSRRARMAVHVGARIDALIRDMPNGLVVTRTWYAVLHARAQQRDGADIHVRGVQHDARGRPPDVQLDGHRSRHLLRVMRIH